MDWIERFIADVEKMFQISREELRKFVQYMSESPEKLQQWAEEVDIDDAGFLMLTTIYTMYKTEEKISNILESLEVKIDEAVALVATITATILNTLPEEDRRPILAQILLATALQLEDRVLRNSLVEYAKLIIEAGQPPPEA